MFSLCLLPSRAGRPWLRSVVALGTRRGPRLGQHPWPPGWDDGALPSMAPGRGFAVISDGLSHPTCVSKGSLVVVLG